MRFGGLLNGNIGSVMGIPIKLHITLWPMVALVAWAIAGLNGPEMWPGLGVAAYWSIGVASSIMLFVSVLLHEMAHAYVAKKNGLHVNNITLFLLGGVADISQEPETPQIDMKMAAAGPLLSFILAAGFAGLWLLGATMNWALIVVAITQTVASINFALGGFNLIPASPLDGGRLFQAILWRISGKRDRARVYARRVGIVLAEAMMVGGIVMVVFVGGSLGFGLFVFGTMVRLLQNISG